MGAALVLVAVVLLGLGLFPQGPLRRVVEGALRTAVGPESRLGYLHVTPFGLRAEVRDVRLEAPGFSVIVEEARAVALPRAVTEQAMLLRSLEVEGLTVVLRTGAEPAPAAGARETALPPILIEDLNLRGGRIVWEDPGTGTLEVSGVSARGSLGESTLAVEADRGELRDGTHAWFGPASGRLRVTRTLDATLESFRVGFGSSRLTASGPLLENAAFVPRLAFDAQVDLADAGRRLEVPGLAGNLDATGRLEASAGETGGMRVTVHATGSPGWGRWQFESLQADASADTATSRVRAIVEGRALGGGIHAEAQLDETKTRGQLRAVGLDFRRLPGGLPASPTSAGGDVSVTWEGPIDGPLQVRASIRGRAAASAGSVRLEAEARGAVRPAEPSVDIRWSARVSAESPDLEGFGLTVSAEGRAEGPLPPEVTGTLSGTLRRGEGETARSSAVHGTFAVDGDVVRAELEAEGSLLTASAEARLRQDRIESLSIHAADVDLARLQAEATGRLRLDAEASGPLANPSFSARADIDGLGWAGKGLGPATLNAEGDTSRAEIRLSLPDLAAAAQGEWRSDGERRLRGRAELQETPLAPAFALLGAADTFGGQLTASLTFDVPLARPLETEATVEVNALELTRADETFRAAPFRAQMKEGRVVLPELSVAGPGVSLDASVAAGLRADTPIEVRTRLDVDLGQLPWPEGWTVSGSLRGAIGLEGTRSRPSPTGALRASDVSILQPSAPPVRVAEAELRLHEDRLSIPPVTVRIGAGQATLQGEVPYAAAWPALRREGSEAARGTHLVLTWDGLALGPLEGGLAGSLTLEGGLASIEEPEATLALPTQKLEVSGVSLQLLPGSVRLENGRVTTDGLTLRSALGDLRLTGQASLVEDTLDVKAHGAFALGLLSPLLADFSIGGRAEVDVEVGGTLHAPLPRGRVKVEDASVRMRDMPQAVIGMQGEVALAGDTATVNASGSLGGGELKLEGEARVTGERAGELSLQLTGEHLALRYPAGFRSQLDVDLTLAGRPEDFRLAGDVAVQGGVLEVEAAVKEALRAPEAADTASELMHEVGLDVTVTVARPIAVRSRFGRLEATGRIDVRGDLASPAPFGRLDVRRGGEIQVQGRDFDVSGGSLGYTGDWNANLSLTAETTLRDVSFDAGDFSEVKLQDYRDVHVTVSLGGTVDEPTLTLTSQPTLSQQQIVSAIATGSTGTSLIDASAWLLGGEAATLATGGITSKVAQTFGLDQITVRPDLVARDTDPSARFTFGKRLSRALSLVYSAGLGGPETRFAEVQYLPGHDVRLRALRRDTGAVELGAGQRFEWGAGPLDETSSEEIVRLEEVAFQGAKSLEPRLREELRLEPEQRVAEWRIQREADRLRRWLRAEGRLDAEVAARLEGRTAVFSVVAGPSYGWRVEGMDEPPSLDEALGRALFEADAIDLGRRRLLQALHARGHLRAEVEATAEDRGDTRLLLFEVTPGPRYDPVTVRFPGRRALDESTLLDAAGGASGLLQTPQAADDAIEAAYRARHFLAATVEPPQVEHSDGALTLTVPVNEGAPARLAWVRFEGISLPEATLRDAVSLETGVPFSSDAVSTAVDEVRRLYLSRGYTQVRVRPGLEIEGRDLGLVLRVTEGEAHRVHEIVLSGNTRTRDWVVRQAMGLEPGEPVDPRDLAAAERRLLQLGTFRQAAIVPQPDRPGVLHVRMEEAANLGAGYDVRWDEDEGWAGTIDGLADNVLGLGVSLGGRVRYGADLREYRGSLHVPAALAEGDVTGSVFRTERDIPVDDRVITQIQTGFQVQQSLRLPHRVEVLAGYRFRRNRTIAPEFEGAPPLDVGGLDVSAFRTSQDDLLDPRRGSFLSLNLNVAPSWLGSDAPLVKAYAQAIFNRSFRKESLTWAQSYRVGLAWGLHGQPVTPTERFKAGGANSIRGYATGAVGPRDFLGEPAGGAAVLLMNQELRYHHPSGLGAALFWDVGNVFPRVVDVAFDFVNSIGAGLRWSSPVGLLRLDLGVPLDPGPEDKGYRFSFGLGQAF